MDVDVVLSLLGVRNERLNEELTENAGDRLNLNVLGSTGLNPFPGLGPGLVQGQKATLSTSLDQLVGLGHELGTGGQQPGVADLSLVEDILDGNIFGKVKGGELRRRVVRGGRREGSRLDEGSTSEVVVEDGLAISFENRLGGHDDCIGERGEV